MAMLHFILLASQLQWSLDSCNNQLCVTNNLDQMNYIEGGTNTSGALWLTWHVCYMSECIFYIKKLLPRFCSFLG